MNRQNITFAIFDVRPIDPETKKVNFDLIQNLKPEINLKESYSNILPINIIPAVFDSKNEVLQELQATLSESIDFKKELELFGGRLIDFRTKEQSDSFDEAGNLEKFRDEFSKTFSGHATNRSNSAGAPPPTPLFKVAELRPPPYLPWAPDSPGEVVYQEGFKPVLYFSLGITVFFFLTFLAITSLNFKNNILQRSNQAYLNLNSAGNNISEFNFSEAAGSFALAAKNFELLEQDLKKAGSIFRVLDKVTLGETADFSNFIKAGELISGAGLDLYDAFEKVSGVNLVSIIQPDAENYAEADILGILNQFRLSLIQASRNLNQASSLISDLDLALVPESERKKLEELKLKLPEFNRFIEKAVSYTGGLMIMLGQSSPQKYIVLFQNTSELRPTGGFPGSYALVEFNKGVMEKFRVDDIYNPDGQMKEKIIPPRPLQKITPNWGMRDANWFIDFRASAKKVAEFYYKDTGVLVDGVLAVNVDLIPEILKVTGPIELADFGITLDSDNFVSEVQKEIEYQRTKGEDKPKQILVEFGPKLLEKLSGLSREDWIRVFNLLVKGVETKDILAYFADRRLESFAMENGLAGEIKGGEAPLEEDYLMIAHSNIMGSKTDAVIDNFVWLSIEDSGDSLIHALEIKRWHKGGELGFYNKRNNDYVRILLPEDAELLEIKGNDIFEVNPPLDYSKQGFGVDPDLERYESGIKRVGDIEILEEGGKKVIAFWMITEPKKTKTAAIKYKTPKHGRIYIQKQPGLKSGLKLQLNGRTLFEGKLESDKSFGF